ncbi:unnamed protein product [Effrenium voratum]|nr:unnamed protein product [Effrenium voratum]
MSSSSRQWQHPFVDVFKTFATDARNSSLPGSLVAEVRGDVSEEMDREICKRVFRIQGPVCANNYIQVPSRKVKCMGLTGEYIYLLVKPLEKNFFLIHLDFVVSSGNRFRISLSNIYQEGKSTYHCINCPCKLPEAWTVVRVHVPPVLELGSHAAPHGYLLRSLQLCASLMVRGVFTSDRFYSQEDAPRELVGGAVWQWLDMPELAPWRREWAMSSPTSLAELGNFWEDRWKFEEVRLTWLTGASRPNKAN